MADLVPIDEAGTVDLVRDAQVARVLEMLISEGKTQAEACKEIGISVRTLQRAMAASRSMAELRKQTDGVLASGVLAAYEGYQNGIKRLRKIVDDEKTAPRDVIAAVKTLHQILREFGGPLVWSEGGPSGEGEEDEPKRVQVAFDAELLMRGPMTVRVGQGNGRARLEDDDLDLDEPVDAAAVVESDRLVAGVEHDLGDQRRLLSGGVEDDEHLD